MSLSKGKKKVLNRNLIGLDRIFKFISRSFIDLMLALVN